MNPGGIQGIYLGTSGNSPEAACSGIKTVIKTLKEAMVYGEV
jgi:hypothetical protein